MLSFGEKLGIYGVIGSFLVVLVWIYYTVIVLFGGALVVSLEFPSKAEGERIPNTLGEDL